MCYLHSLFVCVCYENQIEDLDGHCECSGFFRNKIVQQPSCLMIFIVPPAAAHKYQPEVMHYQLSEWSSGLRIGLITARVGFESQGDYCKKNPKITILIENAVSFVVSHPSWNLFCGGAAWDLCEVPPHYTTQPVSQGSSCHELSSDPLTSGPDS